MPSESTRRRLTCLGKQCIEAGEVGVLILAGGMATRFGDGAKACVAISERHQGLSFLQVKLADARKQSPAVAALVLHSFATKTEIEAHLQIIDWAGVQRDRRMTLEQSLLPRLEESGAPLEERKNGKSLPTRLLYAPPGHGEAVAILQRRSPLRRSMLRRSLSHRSLLHDLRAMSLRRLFISNVDNLGATLDPMVLGAHLEAGKELSAEVIPRPPGEPGASIAQLPDGRTVIVEDFRLPTECDGTAFPHFSINNLWLELSALSEPRELQWFAVNKRVSFPGGDQQSLIQFEQLIGQISELLPTAYLRVHPERFHPIKTRSALAASEDVLLAFARKAGVARQ